MNNICFKQNYFNENIWFNRWNMKNLFQCSTFNNQLYISVCIYLTHTHTHLKITLSANISSLGSRKPHDLNETSLQHNMFPAALPTVATLSVSFQHQTLNSSSAAERGLMIQVNDALHFYIYTCFSIWENMMSLIIKPAYCPKCQRCPRYVFALCSVLHLQLFFT